MVLILKNFAAIKGMIVLLTLKCIKSGFVTFKYLNHFIKLSSTGVS